MELSQDEIAEYKHLFCIAKTVFEMLEDRGYYVLREYKDLAFDFNAFQEKYKERHPSKIRHELSFPYIRRDENDERKLYVFFHDLKSKFCQYNLEYYLELMRLTKSERAIIILQRDPSLNLADIEHEYNIQFFKEDDLLVNITKHEFVPKHIVLNEEEHEGLLKKYKLKKEQLPKIHKSDPVARYYGLERGDIVKIIRESETAGKYVTYRLVQ